VSCQQCFHFINKSFSLLALTFLLATLSGCSTFLSAKHYPLLTHNTTAPWAAQQQWMITRDTQTYRLQAVIEVELTSWKLVVLDSLGQRLFTAASQNNTVLIERQKSHPLDYLITELVEAAQWSYWPLDDLQKQTAPQWQFKQDQHIREIYFSGILRASINYQSISPLESILRYDNYAKKFGLTIESQLLK
jgi:hypothetical protein